MTILRSLRQLLLWLLSVMSLHAGVDSVVTFNEIQYNPALSQQSGEWIELRNQNSVDVDMTGWRLDGGVDYVFPAGTVIRGGGYLVIAANPPALASAAGISGVLGPFANALDNAGETLTLKNNNGRRMDEIAYNDRQPWPIGPDGSGATLAKADEFQNSELPENWVASIEVGGTPGASNFSAPDNGGPASAFGVPGPLRRYYRFEGDLTDGSGNGMVGSPGNAPAYSAEFPPIVGGGQSINLNGSNQYVRVTDGVNPTAYTISVWIKADTIRAQNIVLRASGDGTQSWSHQLRMTAAGKFEHYLWDGDMRQVTGTTTAVAGQWYHVCGVAVNGGLMKLYVNGTEEGTPVTLGTMWAGGTAWRVGSGSGGGFGYFDGRVDELAIWHGAMDSSQICHIATGFRLPTDAAVTNLALGCAVVAGSGAYPDVAFDVAGGAGDFSASNVTDGSASDVPGGSYWLGREGVTNEHFTMDLGSQVGISGLLLRNTHNGSGNDRGTAEFRVFAASSVDANHQLVNPVLILNGSLNPRTVTPPVPAGSPIAADSFTSANGLTPVTARYLKFEALTSSYGTNVGLNEMEVFGTPATSGGFGRSRLVINELADANLPAWWMELHNHGDTALDLTGNVVATSGGAEFTLPVTVLSAGGFLVLDQAATGLHPVDGERIFIFNQGGSVLMDAVLQKAGKHQLRIPAVAGSDPGEFVAAEIPADITPAAVNRVTLPAAIAINEIMYHRAPRFQPFVEDPEEWIELYNKSASAVDVGGWKFDDAVSYTFPSGTVIQPGAYLCVSNDATAFAAAHPGIPVVGNFSGSLSNRGERIKLRDSIGNAVDEVFYRDKEPWPLYTDGLGCSLELKNPEADNSVPESWAASDESSRSTWKQYTYTGTAHTPIYTPTITTTGTTAFHELRMGLLEEGEVLVDDVSVREITTAPGTELMQNGSFSSPLAPVWRVLGNHDQSTIVSGGGNPVLGLRASGPLLYMHNLLETSLKSGASLVPVVDGRQYTISLRAKWLRGCPQLHTEFYYNKLARTFLLEMPAQSGTPGARNSVFESNPGPSFSLQCHAPAVPEAGQTVTVTARITDPQGVSAATLHYSVNGGAFSPVAMTPAADGVRTAEIPGQAAGGVIQFYIVATDGAAAAASWPAAGENSRALIKVNAGGAVASKQNLRIITTAADAAELTSQVHLMSNRRRGCTIIHNERDIFYDGRIRLRGSMFSRYDPATCGESITFPADKLFRGAQRTVSVRRSGMNEIVVKHAINAAGGMADNYNDLINIISFRSDAVGSARMEMERFNNSFLDEFYPGGSDGTMFKLEGIRVPTQTLANGTFPAGNPEGFKNLTYPSVSWIPALDLADLGPDGEQYRHGFRWLNNYSRNDNGRFVQLCRTLSMPVGTTAEQAAFESAIEPLMNVDGWMRTFAMMSLFGIGDVYSQQKGGGTSSPHNLDFYMPPTPDGKIEVVPWDWNFVFDLPYNATLSGDKNIQKVINRPRFKRLFLGHLKQLIGSRFNATYMSPWLSHYSAMSGESYASYVNNITNRSNYVLTQINTQIPPVSFSITTNGGADFSVAGASATLEGDGWVDVRDIRLNGSADSLPVTWLDENTWRTTVPLGSAVNVVVLAAYDGSGNQVGGDTTTITNTSTIQQANAGNFAVSEIHYHPLAPASEFLEVMNISSSHPIDLTGCAFTAGIDYAFPSMTLAPGARFVIPATAFLNDTALNNGGERLRMEGPAGIIRDFAYDDASPWPLSPDGGGPSLVLIAPMTNPDHGNGANWRASTAGGGSPGGDDAIHFTGDPNGDDDCDGWNNLIEYSLGQNPQVVQRRDLTGLTIDVPRVPNADDAEVSAEVSTDLEYWQPALLMSATSSSMTFAVPPEHLDAPRIFVRGKVMLRR